MDTPPRTDSWTDDHARLVAETAPPAPAPTDAEVERIWNLVAGEVTAPVVRRRSRRRIVIGAGVAAIVLGSSGFAAAQMLSARTGEQVTDAETISLSGPGEYVDPRGADIEQVIDEVLADIPFPSAEARDIAVADQVEDARRSAAGMRQAQAKGRSDWREIWITGGMRAEGARAAVCAWANVWAAATRAGDAEGRADAVEMLQAAPSWPAVTDVDDEQVYTPTTQQVTGEDGVTREESFLDQTPFAWLPVVAKAAEGRDLQALGRTLKNETRCVPALMPDLPSAVPAPFRVRR